MAASVVLAALLAVAILWIILGYVIQRGLPALSLAFFTQRPLPYGEPGDPLMPFDVRKADGAFGGSVRCW